MCQGCFDDEWEDSFIPPSMWLSLQTDERHEMMLDAGRLLEAESATGPGPGYWQGGRLHGAVDDDNYDNGAYIAPDDTEPLTPAEIAWEALTVPERSIVVAILHRYDIP